MEERLLFGLVRAVTGLQVWGGEVIAKYLNFKMDLGQGGELPPAFALGQEGCEL